MWSAFCFRFLSAVKLYLLGFKVLLAQLVNKPVTLPVMPRQDGRVAIVTGGGRGIGYEVVRHLARLGAHVIIGGRDEQEGLTAIQRICEEYKEAKAAVMLVPEGRTEDGFEQHFGVNYLGHFLLTWLLLDTLKESGRCGPVSSVVNVTSSAHCIGEIILNDLNCCKHYSAHAAYCNSKLAQLFFSTHFHQEMQHGRVPVVSCAVDPGMVDTALYCHLWKPLRMAQSLIARLLFRTPVEGAATVLLAALSPALDGDCGGGYWANGHREVTTRPSFDPQLQLSLWKISIQLLGLQ
ncbi:dehydrogenase/reductase SDR family member on chromosome X isoform X2 [Austrofundulus limnaeus]|uniref:Dehydrogenase/reductase SDR family member on chromosome X isoform X2 n=1 Tax=Austrofundulus limnaeus TaxID=52670 RepID=A0A2I4BGZ1_AUSLI|nr:PREDICTED: dehydrogenase/reductase SDR family member on chromosome X isoform X2 [Austrofundulus limnaeus]